jgi:hypothetical protein
MHPSIATGHFEVKDVARHSSPKLHYVLTPITPLLHYSITSLPLFPFAPTRRFAVEDFAVHVPESRRVCFAQTGMDDTLGYY